MPKYLPSAFLNEIEEPLRRKRRTRSRIPTWLIWLLVMLSLTVLYLLVSRIVDDQAHAAYAAHSTLCNQYLKDSSVNGTAAQQTLYQVCGFKK